LISNGLDLSHSIEWLKNEKILIHPTEGVWGIGCDAFCKSAVDQIYLLKKRDRSKPLIVLINSLESFQNFLLPLSEKQKVFVNSVWPGHVTLLFKYNDNLPNHLQNNTNKIALRVSNHYPLKALNKGFKNPIISTSANISGNDQLNTIDEFKKYFISNDVAYYDERPGDNNKPSKLIDVETLEVLRD